MGVVYIETNDEKELRKQEEIEVVERCIFPEIIYGMFELNNQGKLDNTYSKPMKRLKQYIDKEVNSKGYMQAQFRRARISKSYNAIVDYAKKMKLDTRKVTLIVMELVPWLVHHEVLELDDDMIDFFSDMQETIEVSKNKISDFSKIEKSAAKKAWSLLEVLQDLGYFDFTITELN
jgi:hypothetical protein